MPYCARCNEPHDPELHFDRWQFDDAAVLPYMDASELDGFMRRNGLSWSQLKETYGREEEEEI